MRMRSKVVGLLVLIVLGAGCSKNEKVAETGETPKEAVQVGNIKLTSEQYANGEFRTEKVKKAEISRSFQALGEFRSKNSAKSTVEAPLGGRILGLLVEEGDIVYPGRPVVRLESPELSQLLAEHHHAQRKLALLEANLGQKRVLAEQGPETQAPLNEARTRLQRARAQSQAEDARLKEISLRKERLSKLMEVGIPSQEQVDQAQAEYLQALAAYQAAGEEVRLAQEVFQRESKLNKSDARASIKKREMSAELQLAREEVRHRSELLEVLGKDSQEESPVITLNAPASGTVTSISTSVGEFVQTGQALLHLVKSGDVYPAVWIPASKVLDVSVGSDVEVFLSTDAPGHAASIAWLAPEIDPETRTLEARLEFQDQSLSARAGIFLKANIQSQKHSALTIPKSALTEVNGEQCVYLRVGQLTFQRRRVDPGIQSETSVEILDGLKEGEECVTQGVFLLKSYDLGTEGE